MPTPRDRHSKAHEPDQNPPRLPRFGFTLRERLEWLLDEVVYADLPGMSEPDRRSMVEELKLLVSLVHEPEEEILPTVDSESQLTDTQQLLREMFSRLVDREEFRHVVPPIETRMKFLPPIRPFRGAGLPRLRLYQWVEMPLPTAMWITTRKLLRQIPLTLLRRCPYQRVERRRRSGQKCGRIFLGKKSQKWCPEHREIARLEKAAAATRRYRKSKARQEDRPGNEH